MSDHRSRLLHMRRWRVGVFVVAGALPLPATAVEVYKWTDAEGRVHFGDKPSGAAAETIHLKSAPKTADAGPETEAARRERTQRLLNEYATERGEREEIRARKAAELAKQKEDCSAARREKADADNSAYLYTRDENGDKQILPDVELRKERARLAAKVAEVCRGVAGR